VRFVDSHLHLEGTEAAIQLALSGATETLLLTCGIDRETSSTALRQADEFPRAVKAFVGVHPSEVMRETGLTWLGPALERASGVGEIGLDPKYSERNPGSAQMKAFLAQLEAARVSRKPVQVHSRDAERECLDVLESFALERVLMHWFQSEELIQETVDRGYFVSFGPPILYSKKLQRMALRCHHGQVLTETDSPVPYGALGGVHGPSLIPSVVFRLSELWGERFEDTRAALAGNAMRFLGLSEKG
jgi:TatD DNase family protein